MVVVQLSTPENEKSSRLIGLLMLERVPMIGELIWHRYDAMEIAVLHRVMNVIWCTGRPFPTISIERAEVPGNLLYMHGGAQNLVS